MRGRPTPNEWLGDFDARKNELLRKELAMDILTAQQRFAAAVRDYTPKMSPKFQQLMPFMEGIRDLRCKHASYKTIAEILCNANVSVSHDMVARFCKKILGLTRKKRKSDRSKRRSLTQFSKAPRRPKVLRNDAGSGPRVANPENI